MFHFEKSTCITNKPAGYLSIFLLIKKLVYSISSNTASSRAEVTKDKQR